MKTYEIEITETLQRVVEIEANSESEAYNIVNQKYKNEEIVLNDSDFVNTDISFFKPNEESDFKKNIKKLVNYLWNDEKKHFEESNKPKSHIFNTILKIKANI